MSHFHSPSLIEIITQPVENISLSVAMKKYPLVAKSRYPLVAR
jgi:hypothetical protein